MSAGHCPLHPGSATSPVPPALGNRRGRCGNSRCRSLPNKAPAKPGQAGQRLGRESVRAKYPVPNRRCQFGISAVQQPFFAPALSVAYPRGDGLRVSRATGPTMNRRHLRQAARGRPYRFRHRHNRHWRQDYWPSGSPWHAGRGRCSRAPVDRLPAQPESPGAAQGEAGQCRRAANRSAADPDNLDGP